MKNIYRYFDHKIVQALKQIPVDTQNSIQEIRLNINRPVAIKTTRELYFLHSDGISKDKFSTLKVDTDMLKNTFNALCEYSVQSYKNEIINGFITVSGGHRVCLCGTFICDGKSIKNVVDISGITFRVARQIDGVASPLLSLIGKKPTSLLIAGAPNTGKTTLIRDLVKSLGENLKISVIDERGEISATSHAVPSYDLGTLTHVYNLCPKAVGISIALKTSSPDIIVCDEIGADDDVGSIMESLNSGVSFICSTHAKDMESLTKREAIAKLLNSNVFEKIVFLSNEDSPCQIHEIIDLK